MKLHSPKLERELRRRVRREIKRSPDLKRQAKQRPKHYSLPPMAILWFFGTMFAASLMGNLGKQGGLRAQLAFVTFISLLLSVWIASRLLFSLYAAPELASLYHNPLKDADIFRRQWRVFLRKSTGFLFALVPLFGFVGHFGNFGLQAWIGLLFLMVLQWWVCVVTAVWISFRFPRFPYGAVMGVAGLALFVVMMGQKFLSPPVLALFTKLAATPYWIIPTGWLTLVIESFSSKNSLLAVGAFVLVGLFSYSLQFALAGLRDNYGLSEPTRGEVTDFSEADADEVLRQEYAVPARAAGPTEIEDDIRVRGFLKDAEVHGLSRLERFLMRGFNVRERMIAEFALVEIEWSAKLRKAAILVVALAIAAALGGYFSWRPSMILYFIGTYILGARFLSITNPLGRIFTPSFFSGTNVPWYSGFPLTYHEISWIIIKLNCMRLLTFAPLMVVYGIATAVLYNYGWQMGAQFTIKAIFLLLIVQPAVVIFFFSTGTNDTAQSGCLGVLTVLVAGMLVVLFLALGAAALFLENNWYGALCGLGAGVISLGSHRTYGWAFNRGRFDLMQVPKES